MHTKSKDVQHKKIAEHVMPGAAIYTDKHRAYHGLQGCGRRTVNHGIGEYVGLGDIHINGLESVWALLKRSIHVTWHHVPRKYLGRYAAGCTFRLAAGNILVHTLNWLTVFIANTFKLRAIYEEITA